MKTKEFDVCLSVFLLTCLVIVTFLQVVFRFLLNLPLAWSEEVSRYTYVFMVNLATSIAIKNKSMIKIEFLELIVKNEKILIFIGKIVDASCMFFTLFVAVYCIFPIQNAMRVGQVTPALRWPVSILYTVQMVLYLLMTVRYFMQLFNLQRIKES